MTQDVRRVQVEEAGETWGLVTDDELRQVSAERVDELGGWAVTVDMMLCIREEPLESVLRRAVTAALQSVDGAGTAEDVDREVWFVTGDPSPAALVHAAARAVDSLAAEIEEAFAAPAVRHPRRARRTRLGALLRPGRR